LFFTKATNVFEFKKVVINFEARSRGMNIAHVLQIPFIPITILLEKKNQPVTVAYVPIGRVVFVGRGHVVV
jgi:hypothetical protein